MGENGYWILAGLIMAVLFSYGLWISRKQEK